MSKQHRRPSSSKKPSQAEINTLTQLFSLPNDGATELLALSLTLRYPGHGFAWKVLGALYEKKGRYEESLLATRKAIALLPGDASSHNNLGTALYKLNRPQEAEASLRNALALVPNYPKALNNLGGVLFSMRRVAEANQFFHRAVKEDASHQKHLNAYSNLLFSLCHDVSMEPQQLFDEHLAFGEQFEAPLRASWQAHSNSKDPARVLHVGFVSGDFYDHAVASFLEPVLTFLARKHTLVLHAYYNHTLEDAVTARLRAHFTHWHDVAALTDLDLANTIRSDGIDILFDLSGHTAYNRLRTFAHKPAPLQISCIGYPATTGLQAMDYRLCETFWLPVGQMDWQFTEKLAYLPCGSIFQPSSLAPPVNALPALHNGFITFGSFNRANKLNDSVIVLWAMLLQAVPTARMVLGGIAPESQADLAQTFAQAGVNPDRLTFFPRSNMADYLALHHQVDVCLDTFPYNGGTTTAHASWMGVPTLTLAGETPPSRFGARFMSRFGLDGFVASSIEDFVDKGRYWAEHLTELAALRPLIRERFNASEIGQPEPFADHLDTLLRTIWQRWCQDLPTVSLAIESKKTSATLTTQPTAQDPSPQALAALAEAYKQQRYSEAEPLARALVSSFPEHGFGWKILGAVLNLQGRWTEALQVQKKTVELRPQDHEAHFNLACGLHQQGHIQEAIKSYFGALGLQPNNALAYSNLGNIFKGLGLLEDAEAYCRQAIALQPDMANAHNNLGTALHSQGRYTQACASFGTALELHPEWAEAYNNLAVSLKDQGHWDEAKACYRKALALKPDWSASHSNLLYCLCHDVSVEPQQLFDEHLAFGEQFEAPLRASWQAHSNSKDPARVLHVGFVSGDFYDHAVASFLEPVLTFLARKHTLVLHAYYNHTLEDAVTARLRAHFTHWHDVAALTDLDLANTIRSDGIDILFDLSGHTAYNRLRTFAHKPAPLQISCIGYPATTGLQAMDYRLCETFWLPVGQMDWQFTEKLAYLPCGSIFQPSSLAPPVNALPALHNGFITFGSFNRANKLNDSVIVLWAMLLQAVPTARMVLGGIAPESQADLAQTFAQAGVNPDRLTFFPRSNMADYLALHHQVDVCLDTFPYNGGTTTAHASWMGVPTLTLAGETPPSRFGARFMSRFGLDGFVASSIEDFVDKGRYWAEHLTELAALRPLIRERFNASEIGQPEPFADHLDTLLRTIWQRWCQDLPTVSLAIERETQD